MAENGRSISFYDLQKLVKTNSIGVTLIKATPKSQPFPRVMLKIIDSNHVHFETYPSLPPDRKPHIMSDIVFQEDSKVIVVLPYMRFLSVKDILSSYFYGGFEEIDISSILKEILMGVVELHKEGFLHKGIKPSNILIDPAKTPMVQLSFSYHVPSFSSLHVVKNSQSLPYWIPPELMGLKKGEFLKQQTKYLKADVWSIGVTALEMAIGRAPARMCHWFERFSRVNHSELVLDCSENKPMSEGFSDFLQMCLRLDPTQRPTVAQLLEHPFLRLNPHSSDSFVKKVETAMMTRDIFELQSRATHWSLGVGSRSLEPKQVGMV